MMKGLVVNNNESFAELPSTICEIYSSKLGFLQTILLFCCSFCNPVLFLVYKTKY